LQKEKTEAIKEKYGGSATALPLVYDDMDHYSVLPAAHTYSALRSHPPESPTTAPYGAITCPPRTIIPGTLQPPTETTLSGSRYSPKFPDTIFRDRRPSFDNTFDSPAPRNDTPEVQSNNTSALENQLEATQQAERLTLVTDDTPETDITTSNLGNLDPGTLSSWNEDLEQGEVGFALETVTETSFQYSQSLARRSSSNESSPNTAESILETGPPPPTNSPSTLKTSAAAHLRVHVGEKRQSKPADTLGSEPEGIPSY